MKLSSDRLLQEANATGFRPESLEKVLRLIGLLNAIFRLPDLASRLVLKGGTALNLFLFDLPRLSVDIDQNYIGSGDLKVMEAPPSTNRISGNRWNLCFAFEDPGWT